MVFITDHWSLIVLAVKHKFYNNALLCLKTYQNLYGLHNKNAELPTLSARLRFPFSAYCQVNHFSMLVSFMQRFYSEYMHS